MRSEVLEQKQTAVFVLGSIEITARHHFPLPCSRYSRDFNWTDGQIDIMGAGSSTEAEREALLTPSRVGTSNQPVNSRVYGRRWLVLTLFSLLGLMQGMVWNFWGPIQNSALRAYGFTKSDIAILVLWGPLGFVPWLLFMWLMDKKGELLIWYTLSRLNVLLFISPFFARGYLRWCCQL